MADQSLDEGAKLLREGVEKQQLTKRVQVPAVLDEIEHVNGNPRGHVYQKFDEGMDAEDVPIVTLWGGDGYGHEPALEVPTDGTMLILDYPLPDILNESGVLSPEKVNRRRHRSFQDGLFIAGLKPNDQRGMNSPLEADWYRHPSGTERRISESGEWTLEHQAGHTVKVHEDEVVVSFERSDGKTMDITVSEEDAVFSGPDEWKEFRDEPTVSMGVHSDGTSEMGGRSVLGDTDANRVDRETEDTRPESPYTYVQKDELVEAIVDPLDDGETEFDNPASVELSGPVDGGFFEQRRHIPERREMDPDVTITDPTDKAFVQAPEWMRQLGRLPTGYEWLNITEDVKKRIAADGSIKPME